jgi:hypothetical protein
MRVLSRVLKFGVCDFLSVLECLRVLSTANNAMKSFIYN